MPYRVSISQARSPSSPSFEEIVKFLCNHVATAHDEHDLTLEF